MRFVSAFLLALLLPLSAAADPLAPPDGLSPETADAYEAGRLIFNGHWRPSGTDGPDDFEGLGPLYNRIACSSCHSAGGRGRPPEGPDDNFLTALVRIGIVGEDGTARPHPKFGTQIQDRAVPGVQPEADLSLDWEIFESRYPDGTPYELRRPKLTIAPDPGRDARWSIRIAPPIHGAGALARAVSPREALGLYGWKAVEPSLAAQNAAAFAQDMGVTSRFHPDPVCADAAESCGGGPDEVGGVRLMTLTLFTDLLPPPVPAGGTVPKGQALFGDLGCAACHVPELDVSDGPDTLPVYSDLALHRMGKGLNDGLPEAGVPSDMWRTPPLWGLGKALADDPNLPLLHDGRARGPEEAILWHGGEASGAREGFIGLSAEDRAALLTFLATL